jgi:drug/metabolite transporter (DMT)-like permease
MMGTVFMVLWYPNRKSTTPFRWDWCIVLISIFLTSADFIYFYSLSISGAMISIVSMIRRSSVLVSFISGAIIFREKNFSNKFMDLILLIIGMVFMYLGSK